MNELPPCGATAMRSEAAVAAAMHAVMVRFGDLRRIASRPVEPLRWRMGRSPNSRRWTGQSHQGFQPDVGDQGPFRMAEHACGALGVARREPSHYGTLPLGPSSGPEAKPQS